MDKFVKSLAEEGHKEIVELLKNSYNHPTAEEIYMIVKAKDPAVSRSTVYRNLGLLVQNNLIKQISMKVGPDRYDYIREPHNHVMCTKCGKIFDFEYSFEYEELKKIIKIISIIVVPLGTLLFIKQYIQVII